MRRRRKRKVEKDFLTDKITDAFAAAMKLWDVWESPDGPAVVVDVCPCSALSEGTLEPVDGFTGGWWVTYRVLRHWGKEAWNRDYREED
jgi:hypothetical protein